MLHAVENSPETGVQAARTGIARQNYREAIGALLPSLRASASADFSFGRGLDPNTNTYTDKASFGNSYGAGTELTIFGGLRKINNLRMQRVNLATGRHQLDQRRDEVAYATMEAFFNVLYYKKMAVLAAAQLEEAALNLRQTERMEELGVKGFPDVAEMRAQEAAAAYTLTDWQNRLAIGVILLKERMNLPLDEELDIAPFDLEQQVAKTPETTAELYAGALDRMPKALAAQGTARAAELALQVARGTRYPTLSMNAGYNTGFSRSLSNAAYESFSEQFRNKRGYWVGATLSIPIFNGFSTEASIRRSRYNRTIALTERDAALRALYTEIEQAVADMNGSADQHAQAVRRREAASVACDANRRRYEEGLVSALELHTAINRLTEARAAELQSRLTWTLKKRMVEYYGGTPLVPSENL
jgi:outer membrane protein